MKTNLRLLREAIDKYRADTGALPDSLSRLADARYLTTKRHLRRIYPNPFTSQPRWELALHPSGGIVGVRAEIPTSDGRQSRKEFRYQLVQPDAVVTRPAR